ncbi:MAG: MBL fold metallo-hydrolase [Candidatus Moraniibacteriota bacterium]
MNIQYYGDYCFKLTTKPNGRATEDVIIVTDIPEKGTGLRAPQGEVQLVLLSHQDPGYEGLSVLKDEPVILSTPGEYAVKGITALGFSSFRDEKEGTERGINTIFLFETEEMRVCFLGALGHEPEAEVLEKINGIDVLFIPVGGTDTLPLNRIDDLIRKIEPKVVIPMHFKLSGMTSDLPEVKEFCKVIGNCPKESLPKWNFKAKDLEGKNMEVVLLEKN